MIRTTLARLMFLLLQGLAVAACGDDGSTVPTVTGPSPTSPSPTGAPSTGSGPVSGSVQDTAYRPLAGALVEVLDGPQAGTSTRAGANGEFSFPGTFDNATRFQASMPDHVAATRTVSLRPRRWIAFELPPLVPPVDMSGEYTLTITADPVCAELPPDARTRTYAASARSIPAYSGTYFDVTLSGAVVIRCFRSQRASVDGRRRGLRRFVVRGRRAACPCGAALDNELRRIQRQGLGDGRGTGVIAHHRVQRIRRLLRDAFGDGPSDRRLLI